MSEIDRTTRSKVESHRTAIDGIFFDPDDPNGAVDERCSVARENTIFDAFLNRGANLRIRSAYFENDTDTLISVELHTYAGGFHPWAEVAAELRENLNLIWYAVGHFSLPNSVIRRN